MIVIGAGFTGLYALHRLRRDGFRTLVLEAGGDVGGTWYWNRYPGARCDIASVYYSYSFDEDLQRDWTWHQRYAPREEIHAYFRHVAERFDLRRDITFDTRVASAHHTGGGWRVTAEDGRVWTARHLVAATGCLSVPLIPELPGLDGFTGPVVHTAQWPEEGLDVAGKRVGVLGTGSSGLQVIPELAAQAAHLTVFQRTASFTVPARNRSHTEQEWAEIVRTYPEIRQRCLESHFGFELPAGRPEASILEVPEAQLAEELESRWAQGGLGFGIGYNDILRDQRANDRIAEFIRGKIAQTVRDPATAAALTPRGFPYAAKRPGVDSGYYETFNRDNVTLVDLRTGELDLSGLDVLVLATGFDAMTGALLRMDIRGEGGRPLSEAWAEGPATYLGVHIAGFPNFYSMVGPGSPSAQSNMPLAAQEHGDWVADLLGHLRERGLTRVEAETSAQEEWTAHVAEVASHTLYSQANSWYLGANVPGKPRVFMVYLGGMPYYREHCARVAAEGYRGLMLS